MDKLELKQLVVQECVVEEKNLCANPSHQESMTCNSPDDLVRYFEGKIKWNSMSGFISANVSASTVEETVTTLKKLQ